ncbi:MAG: MOSC domain-containing protein [Actinophytocola sp.]|nr:MOSC domain-containing protein [Actinophytocola sp.]
MTKRTMAELEAQLDYFLAAPADVGTVELVVRRPAVDQREVLDEGELNTEVGLVGDNWIERGNSRTPDGSAHPDAQITVMSARVVSYLAGDPERRALAGDQLYLDLDLTESNLPAGTRLALGTAVIQVTEKPHTACKKVANRFGLDALRFINAPHRRELRLRGLNAKVVTPGVVRPGDKVTKVA